MAKKTQETVKLKSPDGNTHEVAAGKVHVWITEVSGNAVNPYLASYSPRSWARISTHAGMVTGEVLHQPGDAPKKEAVKKEKPKTEKEDGNENT